MEFVGGNLMTYSGNFEQKNICKLGCAGVVMLIVVNKCYVKSGCCCF